MDEQRISDILNKFRSGELSEADTVIFRELTLMRNIIRIILPMISAFCRLLPKGKR